MSWGLKKKTATGTMLDNEGATGTFCLIFVWQSTFTSISSPYDVKTTQDGRNCHEVEKDPSKCYRNHVWQKASNGHCLIFVWNSPLPSIFSPNDVIVLGTPKRAIVKKFNNHSFQQGQPDTVFVWHLTLPSISNPSIVSDKKNLIGW